MKILVVGDHITGTGPANVTKKYIEHLGREGRCIKSASKLLRLLEIPVKIIVSDITLCSGYSAQNILAAKVSHLFHKKCVYLMHGCVEHENMINHEPDEAMNAVERKTMALCDRIYAVSEGFASWLKDNYPEYASKVDYQINGVDTDWLENGKVSLDETERKGIISIGGGMPRKKIKYIAAAVDELRKLPEYSDLTLTVIGAKGADSDEIDSFECVNNLGIVPYDKAKELLKKSKIFIQNSCFETFGLAPMEALMMGCDVLMSERVGAIELFDSTNEEDIIHSYDDVNEIKDKIIGMLNGHNCDRLIESINKESASWEERTMQLKKKLQTLL